MHSIECHACGKFEISREAVDDADGVSSLRSTEKAMLAYAIHSRKIERDPPLVTSYVIEDVKERAFSLPNPDKAADNIVRWIGHQIETEGSPPETLPSHIFSSLGLPSADMLVSIFEDLRESQIVKGQLHPGTHADRTPTIWAPDLTLKGWRLLTELKRGVHAGKTGFMAMEFGDQKIDRLLEENIRPAIQRELDHDVYKLDERPQAGIIDNIMRAAIQDAAFVLVELSHGNKGAYWEAGYAEGLGKPVIYLCEHEAWNDADRKPHFDVNHCQTVMWCESDLDSFEKVLIATIRNSVPAS